MSREDVQESLVPVWHLWTRVGPTSDHVDNAGQNWPTVPVVCVHCRQFEPHAPVSSLEGTVDLPAEIWPGYCRLSKPEPLRMREPVDTSWVGFETTRGGLGPTGRGVLRAIGNALIWSVIAAVFVMWTTDADPRWWVAIFAAFGLGTGLYGANTEKAPKGPKKGKG